MGEVLTGLTPNFGLTVLAQLGASQRRAYHRAPAGLIPQSPNKEVPEMVLHDVIVLLLVVVESVRACQEFMKMNSKEVGS